MVHLYNLQLFLLPLCGVILPFLCVKSSPNDSNSFPIVINTWSGSYKGATDKGDITTDLNLHISLFDSAESSDNRGNNDASNITFISKHPSTAWTSDKLWHCVMTIFLIGASLLQYANIKVILSICLIVHERNRSNEKVLFRSHDHGCSKTSGIECTLCNFI